MALRGAADSYISLIALLARGRSNLFIAPYRTNHERRNDLRLSALEGHFYTGSFLRGEAETRDKRQETRDKRQGWIIEFHNNDYRQSVRWYYLLSHIANPSSWAAGQLGNRKD